MSDDQGTIEDGELVVEDGEPEQTDNSVRAEDGDQSEVDLFVNAAEMGNPIDESEE